LLPNSDLSPNEISISEVDDVSDRVICEPLLLAGVRAALVGTTLYNRFGVESAVEIIAELVLLLVGWTAESAPVLESKEALVEVALLLLVDLEDLTDGCTVPP